MSTFWFRQILRISSAGVAVLLAVLFMFTAEKSYAQEAECSDQAGWSCITFAGQPLEGPSNALTNFVLTRLRPEVASTQPEILFDGAEDAKPVTPGQCLGVVEKQANGLYLLKETVFRTDRSNGRYNAVVPAEGQHGDWPPHLPLFSLETTEQSTSNCAVTAEISWRLVYQPTKPGTLVFQFELNAAHLNEYEVMASQGGLGLFVAAVSNPITMTVNGETFNSVACNDCASHTVALTDTIGSGVYTPKTVTWIEGDMEAQSSSPLTSMYVLPVKKEAAKRHSVTIQLTEEAFINGNPVISLWFGRFDVPGYNVPRNR